MSDGDFLDEESSEEYRKDLLARHVHVGSGKAVSYLPTKTIEGLLGLSIADYRALIEKAGNRSAVFNTEESCIESGAVFAYSIPDLDVLLEKHRALLNSCGWAVSSDEFIQRIAAKWFEMDDPIKPLIAEAFGQRRINPE